MISTLSVPGPHDGAAVLTGGTPITEASGALILVHGRGATADGMLDLARHFRAERLAWLAPQANGNTWYPFPFLAPIPQNQPSLDSALAVIGALVAQVTAAGIPEERQFLLGFSQGACLSLEFAARSDRRWGGIVGLSGGVIGPPGTTWERPRGIAGTPIFLGCSDADPHIPLARVHETRALFERLGAVVDERIYPNLPHTITSDEITAAEAMLRAITRQTG